MIVVFNIAFNALQKLLILLTHVFYGLLVYNYEMKNYYYYFLITKKIALEIFESIIGDYISISSSLVSFIFF